MSTLCSKIDHVNKELTNWINHQLNNRGWSIRELGRQAGIDPSYLSKVLANKREPTLTLYQQIARAFEVDTEDILRLAGVINGDKLTFNELVNIARQLTPEEREDVLRYALFRLWQKRDAVTNDQNDSASDGELTTGPEPA